MPEGVINVESFALDQEAAAREQIETFGRVPSLAIFSDELLGGEWSSENSQYVAGLERVAKRIGVETVINDGLSVSEMSDMIVNHNRLELTDGIVTTLPFVSLKDHPKQRDITTNILGTITSEKDVDGLNPASGIVPATSEAAHTLLGYADPNYSSKLIAVRGGNGHVGRALVGLLRRENLDPIILDKTMSEDAQAKIMQRAGVIFSATGQAGSLRPEDVISDISSEPKTLINIGRGKKEGRVAGDFSPELIREALDRGWKVTGRGASGVGRLATLTVVTRTVTAAQRRLSVTI